MSRRVVPALLASTAAVLLLASCSGGGALPIGESDDYGDGTMTVTAIDEMTAADIASLTGLDEVEGYTPYFVHYEVDFGSEGDESVPASAWHGDASSGEVAPVNLFGIGDFACDGLGEVADGSATGCQLVFVEPDATLESVGIGASGPWAAAED